MDFNALGAIQGILGKAGLTVNKDLQMQMVEEQNKQAEMQQLMADEAADNAKLPDAGKIGTTSTSSISADATNLAIFGTLGAVLVGLTIFALPGLLIAAVIAVAIFAIVEACKKQPSNSADDGFVTKGPEITQYDPGVQNEAEGVVTQDAAKVSQAQQQINQIMQQFVNPDQSALQSLENMWTSLNQARQGLVWRG